MKPFVQSSGTVEDAPGTKVGMTRRLGWLVWIAVLVSFLGIWLYPVSNRITRSVGTVLVLGTWFGLIALSWRVRWMRLVLLGLTCLVACFLIAPLHAPVDAKTLRQDYLSGLRNYEDVTYYWGGESFKGIDCSGLIRRGLIDSAFYRGFRSFDPSLVRYAIWLWWHDCAASDLGEGNLRMTVGVVETPSINELEHSAILPGDLAVTVGGAHIMAYLGSNTWIEADPGIGRVIIIAAPCKTNAWFCEQMKIMRWSILQ
jgi:hypothetical protein